MSGLTRMHTACTISRTPYLFCARRSMPQDTKEITVEDGVKLYKRSNSPFFQARIRLPDGSWKRLSTKAADQRTAEAFAKRTQAQMAFRVENNLVPDTRLVRHVAEQCKKEMAEELSGKRGKVSYERYSEVIDLHIIPFFGSKPIDRLSHRDLMEWNKWKEERHGRKLGYSTFRNHNSALSRVFKTALQHGWMKEFQVPAMDNPGAPSESRDAFSDEEVEKILAGLAAYAGQGRKQLSRDKRRVLECYCNILLYSGLRPGKEMETLRWCDYDPHWQGDDDRVYPLVRVQYGKRGPRNVICRHAIRDWFWRIRDEITPPAVETDYIFRLPDGARIKDMNRSFQTVLDNLGLLYDKKGRQRTLYCWRHTYATLMLVEDKGLDPLELAYNMGSSVIMLERHYADLNPMRRPKKLAGVSESIEIMVKGGVIAPRKERRRFEF